MNKRTWHEFQEAGLLWWVNRSLHLFGWAIVLSINEEGRIVEAFPARVTFRGFPEEVEGKSFTRLTEYLKMTADELDREVNGE